MKTRRLLWLLAGPLWLTLALGPVHAESQSWESLDSAGLAAYQQGDYAEAEKHFAAALEAAEGYGEDDPRLGTSLNNLAGLYRAQGRYGEAEPLYQRSLAILEKALGPEHPDVAVSLNNLAELYRVQGRYGEAEPLYQRSLAIREKALGSEHPHVAASLENYAALLRAMARTTEAGEMEARAQAIRAAQQEPE